MTNLFGEPVLDARDVAYVLDQQHYLGASRRGIAWSDEYGVLVLAKPTSRRLPHDRWLELTRWCLTGEPNAGSRQWARVARWLYEQRPEITTVVSYSDPSVGHTGALYRACNWLWAPTWHRLRTPPTGNGAWKGRRQAAKDRWVYPLRPDDEREALLHVEDEALQKTTMIDAEYREPRIRRGRIVRGTGGGRWRPL